MRSRINARRLEMIGDAFATMPDRYLGAEPGFDATYHFLLGDLGRTWEVRATESCVRAHQGITRHADAVIGTDSVTWLRLNRGDLSGIEAFSQRALWARGDLDLAVGFEGLFVRPDGTPPIARIHEVDLPRRRLSALTMGSGPDVLLLHGLGATKVSFFDTAAALSRDYRVHALDLPGFGSSSKPATAPYTARYFADTIVDYMDALNIGAAHFVGNSMGGRVALEIGLSHPARVRALALLCPAVAFVKRGLHPLVRVARPEFGLLPHHFRRATVERQFWSLFADRDTIDPSVAEIAVDEFQRIYGSAGARYAFLSAARSIYLDAPFGANGFYPRLSTLQAPALFMWGSHDKLVPCAFQRHVAQWLPGAEQIVLEGCGHVPQIERPEQTNGMLRRFFARADALVGMPQQSRRTAAAA